MTSSMASGGLRRRSLATGIGALTVTFLTDVAKHTPARVPRDRAAASAVSGFAKSVEPPLARLR
jgi:hypothetical protein